MNAITYLTKIFNKCLLLQYFPQIWEALHHLSPPEKKQRPEISIKLSSIQPHLLRRQTLRKSFFPESKPFRTLSKSSPTSNTGLEKRLPRATNYMVSIPTAPPEESSWMWKRRSIEFGTTV
ncbi:hypothetical protein TNCV_264311 [Trichonephila clavipes]|nr:hypothetical protein TNCV_264311 [Trichonephila clavipes]